MLGVAEEKFWDSTPKELEPYRRMDEMQQERLDYNMWHMGMYINNAVYVAVSNALAGKKSRAKYISKPIGKMAEEEERRDPRSDFNHFAAWALVYNENFMGKNGQGG